MTKQRTVGYWIAKLLRLLILFLLIVGTVDILSITQSSVNNNIYPQRPLSEILQAPVSDYAKKKPSAPEQYDPYQHLNLDAAGPITDKKLSFEAKPAGVIARYDVSLAKNHVLLKTVLSGPREDTDLLVRNLLGDVKVNTEPLKFNPPEVVILENDPQARFSIISRNHDPATQSYIVSIFSPAKPHTIESQRLEVAINTVQAQVWSVSFNHIPILKTAERTVFVFQPGQEYSGFGIYLPNWTAPVEAPRETSDVTLAHLIDKNLVLPVLGWLIIGLLEALPFFLTLILARRYDFKSDQSEFERYVPIINIYLSYHFLYFFFLAFYDLTETWINPAFKLVGYLQGRFSISIVINNPASTFAILTMMATFFYVWPAFSIRQLSLSNQKETVTPRWRGYAAGSLYLILFIALVAGVSLFSYRSVLEMNYSRWTIGSFFGLSLSVLLLLLFLLCTWLAFEIFDRRRPAAALLKFFLLTYLALVEDNYWLNRHSKTAATIYLFNFVLVATVMVVSFASFYGVSRSSGVRLRFRHQPESPESYWRSPSSILRLHDGTTSRSVF